MIHNRIYATHAYILSKEKEMDVTGTFQAGGRRLVSPQVLAAACQNTNPVEVEEEFLPRLATSSGRRVRAYNEKGEEITGGVTHEDTFYLDCDQLALYFGRGGDSSSDIAFEVSQAVLNLE